MDKQTFKDQVTISIDSMIKLISTKNYEKDSDGYMVIERLKSLKQALLNDDKIYLDYGEDHADTVKKEVVRFVYGSSNNDADSFYEFFKGSFTNPFSIFFFQKEPIVDSMFDLCKFVKENIPKVIDQYSYASQKRLKVDDNNNNVNLLKMSQ